MSWEVALKIAGRLEGAILNRLIATAKSDCGQDGYVVVV